ncbi:GtrA family protein [Klenkia sp. PcliD-1-E]|uniref:GtrA family protein n=1 Tax=Klenkia sp. PcliD-1-E TaxID=2954492 RepID=UPI002096C3A4|nr:GtrA family protein [Klenkia sp. PcliD-1-E]MCO7222281.1 GtrA family protein [Klenkia sp. PcliD-1-E]
MTCPTLLHRPRAEESERSRLGTLLAGLRDGEDGRSQFARFVAVGAVSSLLYAVLFVALDGIGDQPANLVGAVGSTLLANELHRRLTFHAGGRVGWFTAQWEGGGLAAVGLVATSLALAGLDELAGVTSWEVQVLLIGAVTGAIGLCRFAALRAWVFTTRTLRGG